MDRSSTERDAPVAQPTQRIASLTASRDVATVRAAIEQRYGFTPPDTYISDLIAFIEELTDGQQQQPRRLP